MKLTCPVCMLNDALYEFSMFLWYLSAKPVRGLDDIKCALDCHTCAVRQ